MLSGAFYVMVFGHFSNSVSQYYRYISLRDIINRLADMNEK